MKFQWVEDGGRIVWEVMAALLRLRAPRTNPSTIYGGVSRVWLLLVEPVAQPVVDTAECRDVESAERQQVIEGKQTERPQECVLDALRE